MADKIWQFFVAIVMIALLVAGSIFNVEWALTAVQIAYWVMYPIAFLVLIGVFFLVDNDKLARAFNQPIVLPCITGVITIGLMIYAELIALPVVMIIWYILYFVIRKTVLEEQ